jgi:transcriptional regulator with XRE-family HTH domain
MGHFTEKQVAEYLGISLPDYMKYEKGIKELSLPVLEKLAALYHVEEYDILMGTAVPHTLRENPQQEKELIPFFNIVRNYLMMHRLLDGAPANYTRYRIAW